MYVYKFRLLFDDVDNFIREYEIVASQTFQDFHDTIVKSIVDLKGDELASFYICDRSWKKKREITLINMDEEETGKDSQEDTEPIIMPDAVLSDYIDDPHQRLIYEYDFLNLKIFYIELLKSFEQISTETYPRCVYSSGELPLSTASSLDENIKLSDFSAGIFDEEENKDYYDEEDFQSLNDDFIL
jgi:hypothetical protein